MAEPEVKDKKEELSEGGQGEKTAEGIMAGAENEAEAEAEDMRFPPEEEAALLKESHSLRAEANTLFASSRYQDALDTYDSALASCPRYLFYDRAVVQSNISACHLKLGQWGDAVKAATEALDGLDKLEREDPRLNPDKAQDSSSNQDSSKKGNVDEEVEEEIISTGATRSAPQQSPTQTEAEAETLKSNVLRIRAKSLMRRARARSTVGGWQNLAGAEEDYKRLSTMPNLSPADARIVRAQLRDLPPRTKAAQENEMGEMWGKLKELGNGILKPFGLSTDNFQMVKDEKTGGYSMNFTQGGKPS